MIQVKSTSPIRILCHDLSPELIMSSRGCSSLRNTIEMNAKRCRPGVASVSLRVAL